MDTTRAIAIYGAVVSTAALVWTISRDVVNWRRRVRLLLSDVGAVAIGRDVAHVSMELRVTNVSTTRDIEIVDFQFTGSDKLGWYAADSSGGARPANQETPLPALLKPSQSVTLPIYVGSQSLGEFGVLTGMYVEDSTGRRHHLARRQLRATQERVRKTVADFAQGPDMPYTLRINKERE
jgi:hypothetical protein